MSQGNQSCLRFSLEESVWFQKGQEVAELVSVSLDPDIVIQETDQYVTISGSLQLTGEYKRHDEGVLVEDDFQTAQKFVQLVEYREDGVCEFTHRFPVDITIPYNRIQSIYDVDVVVESFDYVFPERSCLKLSADLTISGLYGDQQHEPAEEVEEFEHIYRSIDVEVEDEQESQASEYENVYLPFEAEARKKLEAEVKKEEATIPTLPTTKIDEDTYPGFKKELVSLETANRAEVQEAQEEQEVPQSVVEEVQTVEQVPPKEPVLKAVPNIPSETEEESSSSSSGYQAKSSKATVDAKKKPAAKKTGMSLTEFFGRKEEAEEHTKLKVCIVQKGDTLDALSERYEITLQNLLRYNQLELNQDVYEGQVLYIPVSYAKN